MYKKLWNIALSIVLCFSLVACGETKEADKKEDEVDRKQAFETVIGEHIQYDPAQPIHDGKEIEIEFWTWDFVDIYQNLINQYESIHPNVRIHLKEVPWEDYWTKLPLVLKSKDTPALFAIHNSYHDNLINDMAPYDISAEDLKNDFMNVDFHLLDDKIYYIDLAMMTANLYYNKDMWEEAGLTEADFPKTWEDVREVAKKLTKKENGNLIQAGFNYNGTFNQMALGLNYQLGQNLFDENGNATMTNDAMKKIVNYFVDLYEKDGVGSKDFGNSAGESFGQGQSAMIVMWGYYYNNLKNNYPNINFGVLETPTFNENKEDVYAINRYNGESSIGISKTASDEVQKIAQDFVKFSLANDEFLLDYSLRANCFPTKKTLLERQEIKEHPVLNALAPNIEKYVWPGPMPSTIENNMKVAIENILFNGESIDEALQKAEKTMNDDLKKSNFKSVENLYNK